MSDDALLAADPPASGPSLDPPGGAEERAPGPPAERDRGKIVALGAMGALVALGVGLIVTSRSADTLGGTLGPTDGMEPVSAAKARPLPGTSSAGEADAKPAPAKPRPPPVFRIADLQGDPGIEILEGTFGKRTFGAALSGAGLPKAEIARVAAVFDGNRRALRPREKDAFVIARDRAKGSVLGVELVQGPTEVWQARADQAGRLAAQKLELFVEQKHMGSALVVTADLEKACEKAGLRKDLIAMIDDAVDGHVEAGTIRPGARIRVALTEDWVEGKFAAVHLDGLELVPKSGSPVRIYHYERGPDVAGSPKRAPLPGFYDTRGKQPYRGAFRTPIPLARVTSRFNPRRLHPVLKTVMPHNGVDFAGSTGTPVYASAEGTVLTAGNGGPCGNMVEIDHAGGVKTVYCHLSRFAPGLKAGQKVEARQLIGAVGQTGRVTGPHLHFGVKRHGVFIDPLALKMDGVRVLPPADRDAFAKRRADVDTLIDGVVLPSALDVVDEPDTDKELHAE